MYRVNVNLVDGQINLVSEGATQVARNEAEAARDVAVLARNQAEAARDVTLAARDETLNAFDDFQNDPAFLARMAERASDISEAAAFVDPGFTGSSTGSKNQPWKTLADAVTNTVAGDTIALMAVKPDGEPYVYVPATINALLDRNLVSYGGGGMAVIEGTVALGGNTWTLDGDGVYFTTYTRGEATRPGLITGSNVTLPQVFYGETPLQWVRGGANQAANTASLKAAASGFCCTRNGGTAADILADTATTSIKLEVKLPGGISPAGLDIRASTRAKALNFGSRRYQDLILRGGDGKDLSGVANYANQPLLDNIEGQNTGEHIFVGLPRIRGRLKARGRVYAGRAGATLNRATVDAVTVYSNVDLGNYDCRIDYLDVEDCFYAMFGHGIQSFRNFNIDRIRGVNLQAVISGLIADEGSGAAARTPIYRGLFTIGSIYARDVDQLLDVAGRMVVRNVDCIFEDTPLNPVRQEMLVFQGTQSEITISGQATFNLQVGAGFSRILLRRNTDATHTAPLCIFDGFTDNSAPNFQGRLARGGTGNITSKVRIVVRNNSSTGSLLDQATGTNFPSSYYLGPGCEGGLGDRTGPQCDTALSGAGLVEDEELAAAGVAGYYWLDPQSTIVNRAGSVLSSPGWK